MRALATRLVKWSLRASVLDPEPSEVGDVVVFVASNDTGQETLPGAEVELGLELLKRLIVPGHPVAVGRGIPNGREVRHYVTELPTRENSGDWSRTMSRTSQGTSW